MKSVLLIVVFALVVGAIPLVTTSGVWLNFVMMALYAGLLAQAWNILGGFGGQFSSAMRCSSASAPMCRPSRSCSGASTRGWRWWRQLASRRWSA